MQGRSPGAAVIFRREVIQATERLQKETSHYR
nr:MAG TPA: hypothetical protein [Caudoviricetes sp.]